MALSLYNKYRPQTFGDVVGQEHVEKTLANAVQKGKVSHAYLFCGPRGTGKTTTARILAKALLCDKAPTAAPDGTCEHCHEISEGIHPDVYELDAASRTGVDNVREEIISRVNFAPTQGSYKLYIIDEVHMLSTPAFNALLKTLEEPPSHVVFVLCTTDVHKVPDTVQARCQRFDFKRLTSHEIVGRLQYICEREGFDFEQTALELIAARSQGGMRDAIRSLEQAAVFNGGAVTYGAVESLLGMVDTEQLFVLCDKLIAEDIAACFDWVAHYVQSGSDIAVLAQDFAVHVRNLYAVKAVSSNAAGASASADERLAAALELDAGMLPKLREQAAAFDTADRLGWMLTVLGALLVELKSTINARLALEIALTRMLYPQSEASIDALSLRVLALEARVASNAAGMPQTQASSEQRVSEEQQEHPATRPELVSGPPQKMLNQVQHDIKEVPPSHPESTATRLESTACHPEPASCRPELVSGPDSTSDTLKDNTALAATDEASLYRQWDAVIDALRKKKKNIIAANLGGAVPQLTKDSTCLLIELPAEAATSKQYLETEANKAFLREAAAESFGKPLEIKVSLAPAGATQRNTSPSNGGAQRAESEKRSETSSTTELFERPSAANTNGAATAAAAQAKEPSVEELENMLSKSLNSTIRFEEQ